MTQGCNFPEKVFIAEVVSSLRLSTATNLYIQRERKKFYVVFSFLFLFASLTWFHEKVILKRRIDITKILDLVGLESLTMYYL